MMKNLTSTSPHIIALDGWRATAVLGVLVAHFVSSWGINLGRLGVELFFVLSGRLMAEILFSKQTPLIMFFPRRFSRIYPATIIFIVLTAIVSRWTTGYTIPFWAVISGVSFTYNYATLWFGRTQYFDHLWSLCIEEHIYILLALIAVGVKRKAIAGIIVLCTLAALAIANGAIQTWILGLDYYSVFWRTDVRGASILLGAIAYLAKATWSEWNTGQDSGALWIMAVGLGGALNFDLVPDPIKYSLGSALLAWAVANVNSAPELSQKVMKNPTLTFIGTCSFSIYLWQQPFSQYVASSRVIDISLILPALAIAMLSYFCVEKPAREALNLLIYRLSLRGIKEEEKLEYTNNT